MVRNKDEKHIYALQDDVKLVIYNKKADCWYKFWRYASIFTGKK